MRHRGVKKLRRPGLVGALSVLAAIALLGTSGCAVWRIKQSAELARQSEPFEVAPPTPAATLLVVGDSTAVGTGASSPASSLPGLIARRHPGLKIINRARDGARFADIVSQLQGVPDAEPFDAVLMLGGGNDVIRLTGEDALAGQIGEAVRLARTKAPLVVVMPSGNVGSAPFFFPPWSWWMTQRSQMLHRHVREAAAGHGALYVNLYKEKRDDPFAQRPDELNARDGLHPGDAGYALWLEELDRQAGLHAKLDRLTGQKPGR
jgi:lysophospholipase L1-like esterase